jgi:hypothetical protein
MNKNKNRKTTSTFPNDRLLSAAWAYEYLGLSPYAFNARVRPEIPTVNFKGRGVNFFRQRDIDNWLNTKAAAACRLAFGV